jgi:hypothetical protein
LLSRLFLSFVAPISIGYLSGGGLIQQRCPSSVLISNFGFIITDSRPNEFAPGETTLEARAANVGRFGLWSIVCSPNGC